MLPVTKTNCAERSCNGKNKLKKNLQDAPSLNLNSGQEILTMVHISQFLSTTALQQGSLLLLIL